MIQFHDSEAGTGTVPGTVITLKPYEAQVLGIQVTAIGTTASLAPKASIDGVTYYPVRAFPSDSATGATALTALGLWRVLLAGFHYFKLELSGQTAGVTSAIGKAVAGDLGTP